MAAAAMDYSAIVHKIVEEFWNKGNLAIADECFSPDYVRQEIGSAETSRGISGAKEALKKWRGAFPDAHLVVDQLIVGGDSLAVRWTFSGTHRGELQGIAPTGRKVVASGISTSRYIGGRCVEEWVSLDTLGIMQQLGVIPK